MKTFITSFWIGLAHYIATLIALAIIAKIAVDVFYPGLADPPEFAQLLSTILVAVLASPLILIVYFLGWNLDIFDLAWIAIPNSLLWGYLIFRIYIWYKRRKLNRNESESLGMP